MTHFPVAVVDFHGTLCQKDCFQALESNSSLAPFLISSREEAFPDDTKAILLPGGFSFGDYIRPGAMAKAAPLMKALREEGDKGTPILGICNGFQILCELRLLPGVLLKNTGGKFICRDWTLQVKNRKSPFLSRVPEDLIEIPIAHKYGNYFTSEKTLREMEDRGQIALVYADREGTVGPKTNPNGSVSNIAGVTNEQGNILGLMPHPERRVFPWNGGSDGTHFFAGLASWLERQ